MANANKTTSVAPTAPAEEDTPQISVGTPVAGPPATDPVLTKKEADLAKREADLAAGENKLVEDKVALANAATPTSSKGKPSKAKPLKKGEILPQNKRAYTDRMHKLHAILQEAEVKFNLGQTEEELEDLCEINDLKT